MDIEISFKKYMPTIQQFYQYFEIMKKMNFIKDVKIVMDKDNDPTLQIIRNETIEPRPRSDNQLVI